MCNKGVKCTVCECEHYAESDKCNLETIEVTHERTSVDAIAIPHFCKSYKKRCK